MTKLFLAIAILSTAFATNLSAQAQHPTTIAPGVSDECFLVAKRWLLTGGVKYSGTAVAAQDAAHWYVPFPNDILLNGELNIKLKNTTINPVDISVDYKVFKNGVRIHRWLGIFNVPANSTHNNAFKRLSITPNDYQWDIYEFRWETSIKEADGLYSGVKTTGSFWFINVPPIGSWF